MGLIADQPKDKLHALAQKTIKKPTNEGTAKRQRLYRIKRYRALLDRLKIRQRELAMKIVKPPPLALPRDGDIRPSPRQVFVRLQLVRRMVMRMVPERLKRLLLDKLFEQFGMPCYLMVLRLAQNVWIKTVMPPEQPQDVGPSMFMSNHGLLQGNVGVLEEEYLLKELVEKFELSTCSPAPEIASEELVEKIEKIELSGHSPTAAYVLDRLVEKIVLDFEEITSNELDCFHALSVKKKKLSVAK